MLQFPHPLPSERELLLEIACGLLRKLKTRDVIAAIPVLSRFAEHQTVDSQFSSAALVQSEPIHCIPVEPLPFRSDQGG